MKSIYLTALCLATLNLQLQFISAAPVPGMEEQLPSKISPTDAHERDEKRPTLPLIPYTTGTGLSAEDYILSHSPTTDSEGFTIVSISKPASEPNLIRGPALTRRSITSSGSSSNGNGDSGNSPSFQAHSPVQQQDLDNEVLTFSTIPE
ncbi:hypothetical protein BGZ94_003152 [Podila epigama]|nr:hypothetical protein BGZ94_003152 [Podila epigama]